MTSRTKYSSPFNVAFHYEMISDKSRVPPFRKAIEETCKDKIVLEGGAGSGILSLLAARTGAKHVYSVEIDPELASFARDNIKRNGYKNVTLIEKDIRQVTLAEIGNEKVDVAIAECLDTWQVDEPEISVMNHVNKYLIKPDGIRLPQTIYNTVQLANSVFEFEGLIKFKTFYYEFSGIPKAKAFSRPIIFNTVDLSQQNPKRFDSSTAIKVIKSGIVNSLRLTSPLQIYGDITFSSSDSLMPPVVMPLKNEIKVHKGQLIEVHVRYTCESTWGQFHCSVN